ncbi:MAG: MerR family transcriptional regulator [Saprospiraceae bacterium]
MNQNPLFDHESDDVRRYFTIGEIADMFNVSKSLIRFWESEFDVLRPAKNSKGDRRFTRQNIEQFRLIYHLVKERGFTLEGAKKELVATKTRQREKEAIIARLQELKGLLETLKANNQ